MGWKSRPAWKPLYSLCTIILKTRLGWKLIHGCLSSKCCRTIILTTRYGMKDEEPDLVGNLELYNIFTNQIWDESIRSLPCWEKCVQYFYKPDVGWKTTSGANIMTVQTYNTFKNQLWDEGEKINNPHALSSTILLQTRYGMKRTRLYRREWIKCFTILLKTRYGMKAYCTGQVQIRHKVQ